MERGDALDPLGGDLDLFGELDFYLAGVILAGFGDGERSAAAALPLGDEGDMSRWCCC